MQSDHNKIISIFNTGQASPISLPFEIGKRRKIKNLISINGFAKWRLIVLQ